MINFKKHTLANGLKVIVHEDRSTPLVAVNILYNVGARDEQPDKTGFAHLFEHLMFGGSKNIPVFDEPLQNAGGENNAFTSNDITNYYETLPSNNVETALWLESDRMNQLDFDSDALDVQRKVVCEEFKEHYINQPYGDVWHKLRHLAYTNHPYQWPTIGKELKHVEDATRNDVEQFFFKYYRPNNAILVLGGNISPDEGFALAEKWFRDIPAGPQLEKKIPTEPKQTEARFLEVQADVPVTALYKAYHMPARYQDEYFAADLLSDVLSAGRSSRLYHPLVKEKKLFSEISAYVTGSLDPGLLVIEGKLANGVDIKKAEAELQVVLDEVMSKKISDDELQKQKNRIESQMEFAETEVLNKAMNLAYAELLGDANIANTEKEQYLAVTPEQILRQAQSILRKDNCSTMYYLAKQTASSN
jgi:zinc protease